MKKNHDIKPPTDEIKDNRRQWIAPQFIDLSSKATAGGANVNSEAFSYHPAS